MESEWQSEEASPIFTHITLETVISSTVFPLHTYQTNLFDGKCITFIQIWNFKLNTAEMLALIWGLHLP